MGTEIHRLLVLSYSKNTCESDKVSEKWNSRHERTHGCWGLIVLHLNQVLWLRTALGMNWEEFVETRPGEGGLFSQLLVILTVVVYHSCFQLLR